MNAKRGSKQRRGKAGAAGAVVTPERETPIELPPLPPDMFINRELSWLEFNRRVLDEAADERAPLLERIKFAAIFASNLDEFFMIRVAGLERKIAAELTEPGPDGRTPMQQLAAVRAAAQESIDIHAALVQKRLLPALADAGIEIVPYARLASTERAELAERFERDIYPILTPQAIDRERRFPHVSNLSLNLIVRLQTEVGERYARVKIPATLPRLQPVGALGASQIGCAAPAARRYALLEEVVAAHLGRLFTGATILSSHAFHVTRDSDIEPDDDDESESDLLVVMRASIAQRAFGPVVRLMVERSMPVPVRAWLVAHLFASERELYVVNGPLAVGDLIELTALDRPDLKDAPFVPAPVPGLSPQPGDPEPDVFATLRERDVLVHHPYQTFAAVTDFVRAAANDPDVVAIKQTLYRIGRDSPLIPALIDARSEDTQVAVLVELKARFDEENNIGWAEELEQRGVHVSYGLAGLKTHCKATLVVRREADGLRRYVHLATGNYNAATARLYEDLGLLTSREDLAADVTDLFNALTGYAAREHYRALWVAPNHVRARVLEAIEREIAAHRADGRGHIIIKVNALVDRQVIRALYAASRAGVRIDLIVRGQCCLRPGVPDWSETIRVVSIVGRFLEHSRIYWFRNGGNDRLYLGSADLMERNLDRRVEVVFPIDDQEIARRIRSELLPAYLRDTVNARELQSSGSYLPVEPTDDRPRFDVQAWLLERYRWTPEKARAAQE
ncbi:MAG: polyphosphate kinase 1 [Thermomicrobiales bacterium]|nr:polyphosphate kinase 1 [Thermomicrobiales bacterium]